MAYLVVAGLILPATGAAPDIAFGLAEMANVGVILVLQCLWVLLFLFYGRSQVTASVVSFHVVMERT